MNTEDRIIAELREVKEQIVDLTARIAALLDSERDS